MIETIHQGLKQDGFDVSINKISAVGFRFRAARSITGRLRSRRRYNLAFAQPIKAMIEESPSFGYRTVAHLLDFNKNTVQRVFQFYAGCRLVGMVGMVGMYWPW